MTTFEVIKEKGIKEGILIEKRNTILMLYKRFSNWTTAKIADFTDVSEGFVLKVIEDYKINP